MRMNYSLNSDEYTIIGCEDNNSFAEMVIVINLTIFLLGSCGGIIRLSDKLPMYPSDGTCPRQLPYQGLREFHNLLQHFHDHAS